MQFVLDDIIQFRPKTIRMQDYSIRYLKNSDTTIGSVGRFKRVIQLIFRTSQC